MVQTKSRHRGSAVIIGAVSVLGVITALLAAVAVHGFFVDGWLLPYWNAMTDAQASIIAQLIFFLAAAWASLLVPLLFGEQLRSLEEAAAQAQETYDGIKRRLEESAVESKRQFSSISRYQQMSLGYLSNDGVFTDLDGEEKRTFIESAWQQVKSKVDGALEKVHGKTYRWVNEMRYRSNPWWERVKASNALGAFYEDFRAISGVKNAIARGAIPTIEQLMSVNSALKRLQDFVSPKDVVENGGADHPSPMNGDAGPDQLEK